MNTTTTTIPDRPFLKPWYRIAHPDGKLTLEYAQRVLTFEGAAAKRLLPPLLSLLDGTRTVDDITGILGEPVRPAVLNALEKLSEGGVLFDGPPLGSDVPRSVAESAGFLTTQVQGGSVVDALATLEASAAVVVGTGSLGSEVARLLRVSGVGSVETADALPGPAEHSLAIVAPAPEELPRLNVWNDEALAAGTPWLQVLPFDGRYAAVGPLYVPGETACFVCFQLRRASSVEFTEEFYALKDVPAAWPAGPALEAAIAGLAATTALRWLAYRDHYLPAGFYALEPLPKLVLEHHYVRRVPRCPACSGLAAVSAPLPWFKEARDDG